MKNVPGILQVTQAFILCPTEFGEGQAMASHGLK
jgi:hypothetical protein